MTRRVTTSSLMIPADEPRSDRRSRLAAERELLRIICRQKADQIRTTANVVGLNSEEAGMLPGLDRGVGLWRVGNRSFVVKNHLTDAEKALTDTDQRMHAVSREFRNSEASSGSNSRS